MLFKVKLNNSAESFPSQQAVLSLKKQDYSLWIYSETLKPILLPDDKGMVSHCTLHQSSILSNALPANAIRLLKSKYSIEILQTWKYEENSRGKRGALIKSRPFQSTCFQIKLIPLISCLVPCFSFLCLLRYSVCASSRLPMALLGGQILISHHFNATDSLGSHRNSK